MNFLLYELKSFSHLKIIGILFAIIRKKIRPIIAIFAHENSSSLSIFM